MKKIATLVAGAAVAAIAFTSPAQAEFILADNVFADLGATGFGNAPRLLTLQNNGLQSGAVISQNGTQAFLSPITVSGTFDIVGVPCNSQNTCSGGGLQVNQSNLVDVTALWPSGFAVGVGLDTNQTASATAPLLFNELVLNIYSSTGTLLGTFGGNDAVLISAAQLALQQGNGNSVFNLGLTAGQQAEFNTMWAGLAPGAHIFAGLAASFGCSPEPCIGAANDGADSFLAFQQVPGPIVGAGIPGILAGCFALLGLVRHRRRRQA